MAHVWLSLKVIIGIHAIRINVHWAIQENDMIHGLMTFRWPHIWLDVEPKSVHWEFQVGWAYPITNHQPKAPVVLAEMQTRPSSLKRVKQTPNISQNKIVCGIFCGIGILWWFFAELTWIPFSRFCRRELCHPREPVWMLLENISHVFQGGLSNTVRCSFICISITFRHPKTFIFRGFDYVSVRLKVKTVSSRDLPVTEWNWWSHWNLVGCLAQTSESRRDEKKKSEQGRLSFFPKPFLKMEQP